MVGLNCYDPLRENGSGSYDKTPLRVLDRGSYSADPIRTGSYSSSFSGEKLDAGRSLIDNRTLLPRIGAVSYAVGVARGGRLYEKFEDKNGGEGAYVDTGGNGSALGDGGGGDVARV